MPWTPGRLGDQLAAVSIVADQAFLAEPLLRVMRLLGDRIVRAKGLVRVAGEERRAWLEKASGRVTLQPLAMDPGPTELVLIWARPTRQRSSGRYGRARPAGANQ